MEYVYLINDESKFLVNVLENLSDGQIQQSNQEIGSNISDVQLGKLIQKLKKPGQCNLT
jgi:hypothetical protein